MPVRIPSDLTHMIRSLVVVAIGLPPAIQSIHEAREYPSRFGSGCAMQGILAQFRYESLQLRDQG
jgi:hypothetical protein